MEVWKNWNYILTWVKRKNINKDCQVFSENLVIIWCPKLFRVHTKPTKIGTLKLNLEQKIYCSFFSIFEFKLLLLMKKIVGPRRIFVFQIFNIEQKSFLKIDINLKTFQQFEIWKPRKLILKDMNMFVKISMPNCTPINTQLPILGQKRSEKVLKLQNHLMKRHYKELYFHA